MNTRLIWSLLAGLVFGIGLIVSGMTQPQKVVGFLDLAGSWDPSLALVMGGAIAIGLIGFAVARRQVRSWSGDPIDIPKATHIDRSLIVGGILFGAGWGIGGFCPGPALVAMATGWAPALIFVAAMLAGMAIHDLAVKRG